MQVSILEKNKTGDIPLINISKQFYGFSFDESLEPFFVKLPKCDHSQCNTVLFEADWVQRQLSWSNPTGQYLNQFYSLPGGEGAGQPLNQIHKSKDDRMLISAPPSGFC